MSAATAGMLAILHEYAGDHVRQILSIALPSFLWLQLLPAFQSTSVVKNWKMILNFKGVLQQVSMSSCTTEQKKEYVAAPVQEKGCYFAIESCWSLFSDLLLSFFRRGWKKIINPNGHPDDYVDCSFIDHDCGESSKQ